MKFWFTCFIALAAVGVTQAQVFKIDAKSPPALISDVQKIDYESEIVAPADYRRTGDRFDVQSTGAVTKRGIWARVIDDWIEPLTPPPPVPLPQLGATEMRVIELDGEVEMSPPMNANQRTKLTVGETIPNGASIITSKNAMCAVLMGGVHSVRILAESQATLEFVEQNKVPTAFVGLGAGAAFIKGGPNTERPLRVMMGYREIQVDNADFYLENTPARTSLAIIKGKVEFSITKTQLKETISGTWEQGPQVYHYPAAEGMIKLMNANSDVLAHILSATRACNHKISGLRERRDKGETLTDAELEYLRNAAKLVYLVRLQEEMK